MIANDLKRRFGAELRRASRRLVEEEVPADMLDCLQAIRDCEKRAATGNTGDGAPPEDPGESG
jgi:hypothetical protein